MGSNLLCGQRNLYLSALPRIRLENFEGDGLSELLGADRGDQGVGVVDLPRINPTDDVTGLQAGLVGGAARFHGGDECAVDVAARRHLHTEHRVGRLRSCPPAGHRSCPG